MQRLKLVLNRLKDWVGGKAAASTAFIKKQKFDLAGILNVLTVLAFSIGVVALIVLIWLYVRPIRTAEIKVPVATDQASYAPGEAISGIFFGDTYYTGEVRVLREVFCSNYKGFIAPPAGNKAGNFFSTQGRPRHLEGQTIMVGNLPADIPIGSNCVLQFTNIYDIQTPFGLRHIEYQYYTQNFAIVSPERRQLLDCEATGRKDCAAATTSTTTTTTQVQVQSSPETTPAVTSSPQSTTTTNNTTNNTTNTTNNPPAASAPAPRYEEQCTINALGIKIGCRQVQVN